VTTWTDYATASAALTSEAGCWTIEARYQLATACDDVAADAIGTGDCGPVSVSALVYPSTVLFTAPADVCDGTLTMPAALADAEDFDEEYQVTDPSGDVTTWTDYATASAALTSEAGCWTIEARYQLASACDDVAVDAIGTGDCAPVSVSALVYPSTVLFTAPTDVCDGALTMPTALADAEDFDEEYQVTDPSGDVTTWTDYTTASAALTSEAGCWTIEARYQLASACDDVAVDAIGTGDCAPVSVSALVYPSTVAFTAPTDVCDGALTMPTALADAEDFDEEYQVTDPSGDVTTWTDYATAEAVVEGSSEAGCWTIEARYQLASACDDVAVD
jgi:predicted outer membrane protein